MKKELIELGFYYDEMNIFLNCPCWFSKEKFRHLSVGDFEYHYISRYMILIEDNKLMHNLISDFKNERKLQFKNIEEIIKFINDGDD